MIRGVLDLGDRPVRSIMSPRNEVEWLDLDEDEETLRASVRDLTHSRVVLSRGRIDDFVGVAITRDLLNLILDDQPIDWAVATRQPVIVHENANVLRVTEQLRSSPVQLAVILDEHGAFGGIATPIDVLEAIAGEFPDLDESPAEAKPLEDGDWEVDGFIDIRQLSAELDMDLVDPANRYSTLAGLIVTEAGYFPGLHETLVSHGLTFEVSALDGRSINKVIIRPEAAPGARAL